MRRRMASTLAVLSFLGTIFMAACASTQNNDFAEADELLGHFEFIGNEYYRILPVDMNNPILYNRPQNSEPMTLRALNENEAEVKSEELETNLKTGHGDVDIKLQKVQADGKTIVIPKNLDDFPVQFSITPDRQKSIVSADNGLWLVNRSSNQLEKLSSDSFNGKTLKHWQTSP